jgi:hypothetical protein
MLLALFYTTYINFLKETPGVQRPTMPGESASLRRAVEYGPVGLTLGVHTIKCQLLHPGGLIAFPRGGVLKALSLPHLQ